MPVLRRESLEEMWRPVLPTSGEASGDSVALSFFIQRMGPVRLIGVAATNAAAASERPGVRPDIAAIRRAVLDRLAWEVWPLFSY